MNKKRAIIATLTEIALFGLMAFSLCKTENTGIHAATFMLAMLSSVFFRKWAGFDKISPTACRIVVVATVAIALAVIIFNAMLTSAFFGGC